jgi:hypothetical protein
MKFDYQTKLVKLNNKIIAFYKYNNNIGFIPADINFTYRNKSYTTIYIMNILVLLYNKNKLSKISKKFIVNDWYIKDVFNKKLFINFYNELNNFL